MDFIIGVSESVVSKFKYVVVVDKLLKISH